MHMNKITLGIVVMTILAIGLVYSMVHTAQPLERSLDSGGAIPDANTNQNIQAAMENLKIEDLTAGTGKEAEAGDLVTVHYTGTFDNGAKFDSSHDHGSPFTFLLGAGQVIPGWDLGVKGMKAGGKRRLTVPPELGYGADDYGPIPGGSTLHFDVELLEVKPGAAGQ